MAGPAFGNPEPDILGPGYEALTVELPDDAEGPVVATLVRYRPPPPEPATTEPATTEPATTAGAAPPPTSRAVLYLHGLSDYFHQRELAEFHAARGDHFYAVDLRKYGRSLRSHQTPCRMSDISDYYPELDAAVDFITGEGHDDLMINAHSTGGLVALLWLHDRVARTGSLRPIRAVVLNSPFLDVPATWAIRALAPRPLAVLARNRPMMVLPSAGPSYYQLSTHRSQRGDWEFVPEWKPLSGGIVRVEWLAAAQRAIATAHAGLGLDCPILVLCSARTVRTRQWTDDLFRGDAVLDSDAIARWSTRLGTHVTCVRIVDGMHDLLLSKPPVRQRVFAEITRWADAYGTGRNDGRADPQADSGPDGPGSSASARQRPTGDAVSSADRR